MTCISTLLSYLGGSCYIFVAIYEVIYHSGCERININMIFKSSLEKFLHENWARFSVWRLPTQMSHENWVRFQFKIVWVSVVWRSSEVFVEEYLMFNWVRLNFFFFCIIVQISVPNLKIKILTIIIKIIIFLTIYNIYLSCFQNYDFWVNSLILLNFKTKQCLS